MDAPSSPPWHLVDLNTGSPIRNPRIRFGKKLAARTYVMGRRVNMHTKRKADRFQLVSRGQENVTVLKGFGGDASELAIEDPCEEDFTRFRNDIKEIESFYLAMSESQKYSLKIGVWRWLGLLFALVCGGFPRHGSIACCYPRYVRDQMLERGWKVDTPVRGSYPKWVLAENRERNL